MSLNYGYEDLDNFNHQDKEGSQGPPGPPGPPGSRGAAGPSGPQGPQGTQGSTGPHGPRGLRGVAGPSGPSGPQGQQGVAGVRGPLGPSGPQGIPGSQGSAGPSGSKGDTGLQGSQCNPGPSGSKGDTGLQGSKGDTGRQGPQGLKGSQGVAGPSGPRGAQGPKGDTGLHGNSTSITSISKHTTLGKYSLKAGDKDAADNNNIIIKFDASEDGKFLLKYYFTLQPTYIKIDQQKKSSGWSSSFYQAPAVLDTIVYNCDQKVSNLRTTTDGAIYNDKFVHRIFCEGIVDFKIDNKITLKSFSPSFGDYYSYLYYNVYDATLSLLKIG